MLVLVVGPSGAGKDTLIDAARSVFGSDIRFRFVRRVITRLSGGGEDHESVTEAEFAERAFALTWQAHGLCYGLPADIADDIARGIIVVANVSRMVIAEAAQQFPVRVIEITAPPELLVQRLTARGRETAADVATRLSRTLLLPEGIAVETIVNDGTAEEGARRFLAALNRTASDARL